MVRISKYVLSALCLLALAVFVPQAKASSADFGCGNASNCNGSVSAGVTLTGSAHVVANSFNLPGLGDGDEVNETFLLSFTATSLTSGTINITDADDAGSSLAGKITNVNIGSPTSKGVDITLDVTWTTPSGFESVGTVRVNATPNPTTGSFAVNFVDISVLPTPEPASLLLLGTGLLGIGAAVRRRFIA